MYAIICTFRTFMIKIPILHISQFKESTSLSEVYVNTVTDHIQLDNPLIAKPHSHNFYLCVMFTQGSGVHEIDFNSYEIKPGTVFFEDRVKLIFGNLIPLRKVIFSFIHKSFTRYSF